MQHIVMRAYIATDGQSGAGADWIKRDLMHATCELFGGCTIFDTMGGWHDEHKVLVYEPALMVEVIVFAEHVHPPTRGLPPPTRGLWHNAINGIAKGLNQREVLFTTSAVQATSWEVE